MRSKSQPWYGYPKTMTIKRAPNGPSGKEKSGKRSKLRLKEANTRDGLRSSTSRTTKTRHRLVWFRNYRKRMSKVLVCVSPESLRLSFSLVNLAGKTKGPPDKQKLPDPSLHLKRINSSAKRCGRLNEADSR